MEENNEDYLTLSQCAEKLNIDKSNLRKQIHNGKYGHIQLEHVRREDTGNQKALALSHRDFEHIKAMREDRGFHDDNKVISKSQGFFYIIQTNPNQIPDRYKCGYTTDMANRIAAYKTVCPYMTITYQRECDTIHEPVLLKMLDKHGERVINELFAFEDMELVVDIIDNVMDLLL